MIQEEHTLEGQIEQGGYYSVQSGAEVLCLGVCVLVGTR